MYKKMIEDDGKEYYLVPVEEMETATNVEPKHTGLGKVDGIEVGNKYYYINAEGVSDWLTFDGDDTDEACIECGNAYTDKQLAEDTARANRIRNALRDYAAEHNKVVLDWEDDNQVKYHLFYSFVTKYVNVSGDCAIKKDYIYFDSLETAKAAIEAVGRDDVTWLLRDFQPWIGAYKGAGE